MSPYLDVPDSEKDCVIALGAQLNASGEFFVPKGVSLDLFRAWLPGPITSNTALRQETGISLSSLLAQCGSVLKSAFPSPVWVRIEISQIKSSGGHLYLNAIERSEEGGNELAKTTAMVWKNNATKLVSKFTSVTGMDLAAGIQVLVLATPEFSAKYGLSLQITDIDPSYTLGDLEARLKRIRDVLEASGESKLNRRLQSPNDFFRVGVISPCAAAGLEDFQVVANLLETTGLCHFLYFQAVFQGEKTKDSIKQAMIEAHHAHELCSFDALVIIRGGGATADLHWLNEQLLARMVCRFRCPVFTGIGHERDKSLLDEYAHQAFGTPSKVITHIKDVISKKAEQGYQNWAYISQTTLSRLNASDSKIDQRKFEIDTGTDKVLRQVAFSSDKFFLEITTTSAALLQEAESRINFLNHTITSAASSAISTSEVKVDNEFTSITLATKRSIDSAVEHFDNYFKNIIGDAVNLTNIIENTAERSFTDMHHSARKAIDEAENSAKDLMTGILAYGVEPTLKRGFAIIRNTAGTVSTKLAAEKSNDLEIIFQDGTMKILKESKNG